MSGTKLAVENETIPNHAKVRSHDQLNENGKQATKEVDMLGALILNTTHIHTPNTNPVMEHPDTPKQVDITQSTGAYKIKNLWTRHKPSIRMYDDMANSINPLSLQAHRRTTHFRAKRRSGTRREG